MYSILDEIDKYIKENEIPFDQIEFNYSYLSQFINQAILNDLRSVVETHFELGSENYQLIYDKNNHLCLVERDRDGRNLNVYYNDKDGYKADFDFRFFYRSERLLIIKSCILKYLQHEKLEIRKIINNVGYELSAINKVKLENKLIENELKNILNGDKDKLTEIIEKYYSENELRECAKKIIDYIAYLYDCYLENSKLDRQDEELEGIRYTEPDNDTISRTGKSFGIGGRERVNSVIPSQARFDVLEDYPYVYQEYAYSESNQEINYMNYLYRIMNATYVLIMEPYNGTKYTKIAVFKDEDMTKEKFMNYVKYYLELSEHEFLSLDNTIRSGHTSIEIFEDKIQYILSGVSNFYGNEYFKGKVRKLKEQ